MATPINIIIDDASVISDVARCTIGGAASSFCKTVSLSMKSLQFFAQCAATERLGELRLKVVIGATSYEFLVEERSLTPEVSGVSFTVWGRSKQALLEAPHSELILDTDSSDHPWQSGDMTASAVVSYVVSHYCPYGVTVDWNVLDFVVYAGTLSVQNDSPLEVISQLASVIGAELVAHDDGSLSVETYDLAEGTVVQSYDDLDDLAELSESVVYPSGLNAVTVYGYVEEGDRPPGGGGGGTPSAGARSFLRSTRLGTGAIYAGWEHIVRVYYYHSRGLSPRASFEEGRASISGAGNERISEQVELTFGQGNTSLPDTSGTTEVSGSSGTPFDTVEKTYSARYVDYKLRADDPGDYKVMFYFADKSNTAMYQFTVVSAEEAVVDLAQLLLDNFDSLDTDHDGKLTYSEVQSVRPSGVSRADFDKLDLNGDGFFTRSELSSTVDDKPTDDTPCAGLAIEKISPDTVRRGSGVVIGVYGNKVPTSAYGSGGVGVAPQGSVTQRLTEDILIKNGVGELSYPIMVGPPQFHFSQQFGANRPTPAYKIGSKLVTVNSFKGYASLQSVPCTAVYQTVYRKYYVTIPVSWQSTVFSVWFVFEDCAVDPLELTVSLSGDSGLLDDDIVRVRDITIYVTDYATDISLDGVEVRVDGVYKGVTGADGSIDLKNMAVGDHTLTLKKSGYLNSELDDLANDTFTVTE